jgi:Zn-dependent protease
MQWDTMLYLASVWVLPVLIAVTLHEAAHGFVAHRLGDDTAYRAGRVTFNPLKHVDLFGTILMPAILILLRSPVLFGYAKPVPVDFRALRNPRRDMVLVALAGPGINVALAVVAGLLLHLAVYLPPDAIRWAQLNLFNAIVINIVLAVFNMLPLPPLDGSKVLAPFLPIELARPYLGFERFGMVILLLLVFIVPMLAQRSGIDFDVLGLLVLDPAQAVVRAILSVVGA